MRGWKLRFYRGPVPCLGLRHGPGGWVLYLPRLTAMLVPPWSVLATPLGSLHYHRVGCYL